MLLLTFFGVYNLYIFHTQITVKFFITSEHARCENLTMLVLGDWGDTLLPGQQQVADRMAEWAEVNSPQFIISTGDNFYPNGVRSVDDRFNPHHCFKTLSLKRFKIFFRQFDTKWRDVYNDSSIADLDWYLVVGNHDYGRDNGVEWNQVRQMCERLVFLDQM